MCSDRGIHDNLPILAFSCGIDFDGMRGGCAFTQCSHLSERMGVKTVGKQASLLGNGFRQ